ncbi:MAG: hypothetical protein WCS65_06365 [Verrucomicrobiae bacterium]
MAPVCERGFALVSVLAILALLLVLVLSVSTVLHVETRSSAGAKNLLVARQNALLGLDTAMGQLQEYAGRDQAVTFPATTFYPTKDINLPAAASPRQGKGDLFDNATYGYCTLAATSKARSYLTKVGTYLTPNERATWDTRLKDYWNGGNATSSGNATTIRNPRWTGIMDSSLRVDRATDPNAAPIALAAQRYESSTTSNPTKFGEPKRDQLPIWLVSGNEKFAIDQATDTAYPAGYQTPDTALPDPLKDDSVVYLVGDGSSGNATVSSDGMDGRVKAKKQEVKGTEASGNSTVTGHYAYWVGDESTKANFGARDRTSTNDTTFPDDVSKSSTTYRNRLQVPQRVGWENITGFGNATFSANDPNLENISTSMEIGLMEDTNTTAIKTAAKNSFHSLTAFSKSLLTDAALGGLKKDLTAYLKTGSGLSGTIPNASLYLPSDSRFRAWGGNNTGFNGSPPSINAIPKWDQIRTWYTNEADASGSIAPSADIAPAITSIMYHAGLSYDGATKKIRWHLLPCIVLWNPYDVGLQSATYDLEIKISPVTWLFYVAKENPTLVELQQDAEACWVGNQTISANSTATNGPDGLPILDRNAVPYSNNGTTSQTITIFKGIHKNLSVTTTNPNKTTYTARYFAKITSPPDSVDMTNGPWTYENPVGTTTITDGDMNSSLSGYTNGTTDAFGRYFYYLSASDPSTMKVSYNNDCTGSCLGPKNALRYLPFNTSNNPKDANGYPTGILPLRFRLTASFGAGESRIFTIGSTSDSIKWDRSSQIPLKNDFDELTPGSVYFDALNVANGPSSSLDGFAHLRFVFSVLEQNIYEPIVNFSINGNLIMKTNGPMGAMPSALSGAIVGADYDDVSGYSTRSGQDDDSDGRVNREEQTPKFVSCWRPLYDAGDFDSKMNVGDGAADPSSISTIPSTYPYKTNSSIWMNGIIFFNPLTGNGGYGADTVHSYISAFSRFNLGAKLFDFHPLVDRVRDGNGESNKNYKGIMEGLIRLNFISSKGGTFEKWNDSQSNAGNLGYSLINYRNLPSNAYSAFSSLPIRNGRRAGSEILSLGQFQQVNLSTYFWEPTFPIGNSDAAPYTDREAIAGLNSREMGSYPPWSGKPAGLGKLGNDADNTLLDLSYLLNENLWDRYFLSTIPQSGSLSLDNSTPLSNSRIRFRENLGITSSDARDFDTASANLFNFGALNVNSPSVEAWKALLTAFRNLKLTAQTGGENAANTVPVCRSLDPNLNPVKFTSNASTTNGTDYGNVASGKDYSKMVGGFRFLTDAMIQTLAERIVDEIRLRGPFLSLADFVNRRLVAPQGSGEKNSFWYEARTNGLVGMGIGGKPEPDAATIPDGSIEDNHPDFMDPGYSPFIGLFGLNGALQRAINVSGINGGVNHPGLYASPAWNLTNDRVFAVAIKNGGAADYIPLNGHFTTAAGAIAANTSFHHSIEPSMRSHLDTEHLAGSPAGEAGQLFAGAPGFVTQGDLLAMIGPALTPRGDTFLIRTYGDAMDSKGKALARAYIEAVVQRVPDPVAPVATTGADKWRPKDQFGRKFKIVKMRWLNPDEI